MRNFLFSVSALISVTSFVVFSALPQWVSADEYGQGDTKTWSDKPAETMLMGIHNMAGTIETINSKTGWMKLKTAMGELTIHYPPQTVSQLKKGDKITVHLSYTKEDEQMKDKEMMKGDKM